MTDFLYPQPSFWEGAGRIIDFGNFLEQYNMSSSPGEADRRAIVADWLAVGLDMTEAMKIISEELEREVGH